MTDKDKIEKIINLLDSIAYSERYKYRRRHEKQHYYRMQMCDEIIFKIVDILKECNK